MSRGICPCAVFTSSSSNAATLPRAAPVGFTASAGMPIRRPRRRALERIFFHDLLNTVADGPRLSTSVNRLQLPSDGDIALPRGRMNIAGMLPGMRGSTTRHSWSGVRPLHHSHEADRSFDHDVHGWSRDFTVIDHAALDRESASCKNDPRRIA